ncbi:hypothetical protein ASD86_18410 [Lysobacter sp. Root690]|nr:hypothetical protein ASD86_18410 [Lysobacter sp. Root690]
MTSYEVNLHGFVYTMNFYFYLVEFFCFFVWGDVGPAIVDQTNFERFVLLFGFYANFFVLV